MIKKVIYDVGSNNGDDIPYYLMKAEKVVAIEANPVLAEEIKRRFSNEMASGNLFVENFVVTVDSSSNAVPFYIHKKENVLSRFVPPDESQSENFEKVLLPSRNIVDIIQQYGSPYYIKIDVEHYDEIVLKCLFVNNIRPPYISAESHRIDVFCLLVALGEYDAFKLVDGPTVPTKYSNHLVEALHGPVKYSFPRHSAGPFGNDISGPWMTKDVLFNVLSVEKLGWKDIHATKFDIPDAKNQ